MVMRRRHPCSRRDRLHRHAERRQHGERIGLGVHRVDRAGRLQPVARRVARGAGRRRPGADRPSSVDAVKGGADLEQAAASARAAGKSCAVPPTPGWRAVSAAARRGRPRSGWSIATKDRRHRISPPTSRVARKLNVTHSVSPWAARTRRASAVRPLPPESGSGREWRRTARQRNRWNSCRGRAGGKPPPPGRLPAPSAPTPAATASARALRQASATRSSAPAAGHVVAPGRHGDRHPLGVSRLPNREPETLQRTRPPRPPARSTPPSVRSRENRRVASRCQSGSAPSADTTSLAVAAAQLQHHARRQPRAMAIGNRAGSMPRSKRWRASLVRPWRRPVSADPHRIEQRDIPGTFPSCRRRNRKQHRPSLRPATARPAASAMTQSLRRVNV